MFDWEDLRHFSAFIREGSLSAAAKQLGVDHVTVARRIAALDQVKQRSEHDSQSRCYHAHKALSSIS